MSTERKKIRFQVGEIGGPGSACSFTAMATFEYEDGDIVSRADGYTGRGTTTNMAALDWCRARLGYDTANPGVQATAHKGQG